MVRCFKPTSLNKIDYESSVESSQNEVQSDTDTDLVSELASDFESEVSKSDSEVDNNDSGIYFNFSYKFQKDSHLTTVLSRYIGAALALNYIQNNEYVQYNIVYASFPIAIGYLFGPILTPAALVFYGWEYGVRKYSEHF